MPVKIVSRATLRWLSTMLLALFAMFAAGTAAQAQHTSAECPPQAASVTSGGTVTINVTDCAVSSAFFSNGTVDGGSTGALDFPDHGSANLRFVGSQWFVDYSHNGSTGVGSTDVFEFTDGTPVGNDVRVSITINASSSPITVLPSSLSTLTAGATSSQTLTASGGLAPYTYTLQAGALPPGMSLSSGGVLSGIPTQRGGYSFSVRATDSTSPTAQFVDKGYTGTVQNPTLTLGTSSGTAIQGVAFSQALITNGGVAPYVYQLETGAWPAGITLSSSGVISGTTVAAAGNYPVTIRVGDSSTGNGTYFEVESFTLTISPPPSVTISVSPASVNEDGVTNLVYTVSRSAATSSAATVNLTYSGTANSGSDYSGAVASIVIPANANTATLTLDPTADTTSEANETVTVSIAAGSGYTIGSPSSATATIVNDEGTSIYCPTLLGTVAWGGSISINAGSCNAGFGLGVVLTPPVHGTATVGTFGANQPIIYTHNGTSGTTDTFTVNDGEAPPNNQIRVNITITPPTSSIVVNPATLPAITSGASFSQTLTATGGTGPYGWTISGGTIPPGLTLSSGGVISGTPTQRGAYNFTVRAQDSLGAFSDKGYSGTVGVQPLSITPGSATGIQNVPFTLNIAASGGVAPYSFLHETVAGPLPPGMSLSSTGVLSGTPTTIGTTNFQMRVTDSSTGTGSYFELENFSFTVSAPPSVSIAVSPASVSEDGATNLSYTVTRSLNLSSPTVVNLTTSGTATAGSDYSGAVATVTIPAGATTATVTIDPTVDATVEGDETVTLTVAAGTGYTVGSPASATATILNDDVPSATITVAPASVAEDGAPNLVYTVMLNQAAASPVSVGYTIGGTATNGTDYATIASPLVIAAGATTGTITVNPTADAAIEANETVILTLAAGAGYTVGVPNAATGTILNDDLPNLTINDVTLNEGNSGTTNAVFTVSLSAPAGPGGVTFDIATANGTATAGTDYVAQSLTGQAIPAGSSTYSFTVQLSGDVLNEASETFFVNVTNVINAVVVDGQGVGTITNDDPLPSISTSDVSIVEGNSGTTNAVVTVTLSAASAQTVTVNYATANGTATQPADYIAASGTLTFAPGQTVRTLTLSVVGETAPETNEIFSLGLFGATNATIATPTSFITITNDDVPITVTPPVLPNGTVASVYSQALGALGGTAPYGFAVTAGALPAGLTLSGSGVLSGTPTAGGSFNFTVTATDNAGAPGPFSGSQAYALTIVAPTIALPATTLTGGTLGSAYSASISSATGGTAPYGYAVTAGALPGGLTLNTSSGSITGTPSALGTFNFAITATDSSTGTGPYTATQSYAITVIDVAPVASDSSLTVTYNAAAGNVPLSLSGGAATSLSIASAPSHGTATVSGTTISYQPTAGYAGADSFSYSATNSGGTSAPATVSITVSDPVVTISAGGSLNASVGSAYSQTFTFNGGATPWSGYQVTNLPTGLSITGNTASSVTISGVPTQAGSFSLNISATDSSTGNGPFSVGQVFTLSVAGPVLSLSPSAGPLTAPYGAAYSQAFTGTGGTGGFSYNSAGSLPPGLTFAAGSLSGTPTAPGSYSFSITATDTGATGVGAPFSITQNYTLDVPSPTIAITPAALPSGTAAVPYAQTIAASGGVSPLSFGINSGALPAGLTLASGGSLSGIPTEVGSFAFSIIATDANGQSGTRSYTLVVAPPVLVLTPASGSSSVAYGGTVSQSFTASGGNGPYTYASSGGLPNGLALDYSTGLLSGSTIAVGSYNFTIAATDTGTSGVGAPFSITRAYTLTVNPPILTITPASLPGATVASSYNATFSAAGGAAPHSFTVTAGALPAGINLSTGGVLSGTPTEGGSFSFTVTASDNSPAPGPFTASQAYTLTVAAPTINLPATSLPGGQRGTSYSATLNPATGGTAPYSYAVTGGALPSGVSLSSSGELSGTPVAFGSFPFTVTVTDSSTGSGPYSADRSYSIVVVDQPPVSGNVAVNLSYGAPATPIALNLSGGAATSVAFVSAPVNGIATISGTTISYQPNASFSGIDSFSYTATNSGGTSATATVTINVGAPTLTVTASDPLNATVGILYSQTFTFAGGTGPFGSHQVTGLPAGLALTGTTPNSVTLSGTPRAQGTFTLSVSASDSSTGNGPFMASQNFTLTIAPPALSLSPASGIFNASYAAPFSQGFTANGGIGSYSYALGGSLPAGVTLDASTGTLSGTPTATGSFAFTVTATDNGATGPSAPFTVGGNYTLTIAAPTILVTPPTLPNAIAGTAYSVSLAGSGAVAPYSFSLASGALPAGIALASNGQLAGTPTASGSFTFTINIRDTNGQTGSANLTLAVNVPTLVITPSTLPIAVQGVAYDQRLSTNGGVAPYTYAVSSGALPAGLTLNTLTGAISGTPTGSGTANFAITVTDSTSGTRATATVNYTLQITARPDPANDPEVRGLVQAQVAASRRFADAQVNNFMRRLEAMHGGGGRGGFQNGLRISTRGYCEDSLTAWTDSACSQSESKLGPMAAADSGGEGQGGGGDAGATQELPWTFWAGGTIRFGDRDPATGRLRQKFESEGISLGADYRFSPGFAAGIGVGLGRDTVDIGDNGSQSQGEAKTMAIYGSHTLGQGFYLDWLGGYQWLDFDLRRYVTSTGALVNSNRSGRQWFATASTGADIETGNWMIAPYARIDLTRGTLRGYSENSGSLFDLTFLDQNVNFTSLGLGTRINYLHRFRGGKLLPRLRLEYSYDLERNAEGQVAYRDLINGPFSTIPLIGFAREQLMLGLGAELQFDNAIALELEYLNRIANGSGTDQAVQVGVSAKF